jgi:DNA-binding GntR family transcriptional regulator
MTMARPAVRMKNGGARVAVIKADAPIGVALLHDNEKSLTDRAYSMLEEMIVTLKLPPGKAVSEQRLSQALGIGRTPIREALQRLARERLVTILPRRGIIVSEINVKSQLRLLEVRREVERLVARSAARRALPEERARFAEIARIFEQAAKANDETTFIRIDREFNELCSKAARNEFAAGAMGLMHSLSRRFWFIHYKQAADMPLTAKLHADIARAISKGSEDAAAKALDRLVDNIEEFTRATVGVDS